MPGILESLGELLKDGVAKRPGTRMGIYRQKFMGYSLSWDLMQEGDDLPSPALVNDILLAISLA